MSPRLSDREVSIDDVRRAARALRPFGLFAPLRAYELKSPRIHVWAKHENFQPTGSFKVRNALCGLLLRGRQAWSRGVVGVSTGNHGAALAWAARRLGTKATIVLPTNAQDTRIARIHREGGIVLQRG